MTTQTEALKLALEALLAVQPECDDFHHKKKEMHDWSEICKPLERYNQAITAIKEALAQPEQEKERCVGCEACIDTACGRDECPKGWPKAAQPEQEPVAWMLNGFPYKEKQVQVGGSCRGQEFPNQTPLYTTPPQRTWVGLTDKENAEFVKTMERGNFLVAIYDIEKKIKGKNT